jgi:NADPH2:quinone reductase
MRAAMSVPGPNGGHIEVRDIPEPSPGEGQILVHVHASGINRGEITRVYQHTLAANPKATQFGNEWAGEVIAAGLGVTKVQVGDRVMGRGGGGHAQYTVVDQRAAMRMPEGMSWTDAASLPNVCVTAHDALTVSALLQPGESMLVNAASSGVGIATIQIARLLGASPVIGTSRSAEKLERLRPLGLDCAILASDDLVQATREATGGRGLDVVIDNVGATVLIDTVKAMAYKGRIVQVGRLGANEGLIDLDLLAMKRVRLIGTSFRMRSTEESLQASEAFERALLPAVADGRIKPVVDRVFPLEQIRQAFDYMESNAQVGKIVLTMDR